VGAARREVERASRRDADDPALGIEHVEEREEIPLVGAAAVQEHQQPLWGVRGGSGQVTDGVNWHAARTLREASEHRAEERVTPGRLGECAWVAEERWNSGLTACGVVAVDEVAQWIKSEVLCERHADSQPTPIDWQTLARLVKGEPEEHAVGDVDGESGAIPAGAALHALSENRNVRVVACKDPLVQRLLQSPEGRCCGAGGGGPETSAHGPTLVGT
jgi:hypothetical protein